MAKYRDIADAIREKIKSGEYTSGQKLPYEYLLCVNYHCNKETMKKALEILVKEGLIIRRRGAGTFVKELNVSENNETVRMRSLSMRFEGHDVTSDIKVFEVIPSDKKIAENICYFLYYFLNLLPKSQYHTNQHKMLKLFHF